MYSDVVTCPEEKQGRNPGDGKNSFPKSDELLTVHTCQCFYESTVSPHMFRQECILLFPWHFGKSSSTSLIVTESTVAPVGLGRKQAFIAPEDRMALYMGADSVVHNLDSISVLLFPL